MLYNRRQTLKNILTIRVPDDPVCHLLLGNGKSGNLDLVFVGDQDGYTTVEDFFMEALGELRSLEERGKRGSEDGLATTYSKKINLWVAGLGNLGCVSETSARGGNYATCNEDELHRIAARCPAYDVKVGVGSRGFGGGGISKPNPPLSPKRVVEAIMSLVFGRDSSELIKGDTIFLDGSSSAGLFWHELGHAIGGITDYYRYDPQCKDHPSRMCDSDLPFSNEKASRDKFLMVRELNKSYCNGIIEASQPFPDTINPLSSEPSYRSVKFQVRAKYPTDPRTDPNENTCFATLEVYDTAGKLVRSLTSPEPIEPGRYDEFKNGSRNYVLEWNGRGPDGAVVASGQYFFKIAMRNELTKNSQDGARLRVILVK